MTLNTPIRVLLADDHEAIREGFQVMMKNTGIVMVGEARNGKQLIQLASQLKPDIIITDILMPEMNGIDATVEITTQFPAIGIIAFSMSNEETLIVDMLKAGARGYILKSSGKDEVIAAVRSVFRGHPYYCRETDTILTNIRKAGNNKKPKLNHKELMIIKMICQELSSREIGDIMSLSRRTVDGYRQEIIEKIRVRNTAGIVLYAIKNKIFHCRK